MATYTDEERLEQVLEDLSPLVVAFFAAFLAILAGFWLLTRLKRLP